MDFRQNNRANTQATRSASVAENRPIQPVGISQPSAAVQQQPSSGGKKRLMAIILALLLVAILVAGAAWWFMANKSSAGTGASVIKRDAYQAVFLTNGQVYFGKLQDTKGDYITIKDIYYLQVQEPVQPAEKKPANEENNVQLIKLGNELHGPEDQMQISNQQVLFWENLKPDSKVSQAISQHRQ